MTQITVTEVDLVKQINCIKVDQNTDSVTSSVQKSYSDLTNPQKAIYDSFVQMVDALV